MLQKFTEGDNATLRVPDVDRGPSDPRNILVVVLSENDGLYKVGCREGTLDAKFTAADLEKLPEALIEPHSIPEVTVSLRTAVSKATGGQGYTKCSCRTKCDTGRCSCKKKKMNCNSRCHPGISCKNA